MIAAPPPASPSAPAPAPPTPNDLAFELGRAHALRQLCLGRSDGLWREKMSDLLKAEGAAGARRQALTLRFNAGYADAHAAFPSCGEASEKALRESAARGAALAHALAASRR